VSCIWDALNMYVATELQQFKFRFNKKSKFFNIPVPISPLFHLSRFDKREVWVWISFIINQCFSYSKLFYNSRCCLIPFGKGHICCISKFMNTFRVVYSIKALCCSTAHAISFDNVKAHLVFSKPLSGCLIVQKNFSDNFGGQINPGLTQTVSQRMFF